MRTHLRLHRDEPDETLGAEGAAGGSAESAPVAGAPGGSPVDGGAGGAGPGVTLRFPGGRTRTRERLVAGAVGRTPWPEPMPEGMRLALEARVRAGVETNGEQDAAGEGPSVIGRTYGPRPGPLAPEGGAGGAGRAADPSVMTGDELIRQIERTLDRMQTRLKRVQRQVDEVFKFPEPRDEGPRAA